MVKYKIVCPECNERMFPLYYYNEKRKFKTIIEFRKGRAYYCRNCRRFRFYNNIK